MNTMGFTTRKPEAWLVNQVLLGQVGNPVIMGILNVTPDSFHDGGSHNKLDAALNKAKEMISNGAQIIDVGGESTRPGAPKVSLAEELERVIPVIKKLARLEILISIDTTKATVAEEALKAGAHIVNDVSAMMADEKMIEVVVSNNCSIVLNHMQGDPQTMQNKPSYDSVVQDVRADLIRQANKLIAKGFNKEKICIDPGIGFGKDLSHNLELISNVSELVDSGFPVLMGTSRKSFIPKIRGLEKSDRLIPSVTSNAYSRIAGCSVFRVHDVKETNEAFALLREMEKQCLN
jgi:dihydropteroate synthase